MRKVEIICAIMGKRLGTLVRAMSARRLSARPVDTVRQLLIG